MYDFYLGGKNYFHADRIAAEWVIEQVPLIPLMAIANRAFLRRSVEFLALQGIRQFLDIGCGIPTMGNVHEVAQRVAGDARVLYVDIDPVAVHHASQLLQGNDLAHAMLGDLRDPQRLIDEINGPSAAGTIDLEQPTALLLNSVLPFVPDDRAALAAVGTLREGLAPGSFIAVSHIVSDGVDVDRAEAAGKVYKNSAQPASVRTREQIEKFFDGFDLVEPGLVWITQWRPQPDDPPHFVDDPRRSGLLAGVGALRPLE
jgi:hypothetical protein